MGYDYDAKGNVISLHSTYDWLGPDVITQEFTYDSTDQLIAAEGSTQNDDIYSNEIIYGNWGKVLQYDIQITDPLTSIQTERQTTFNYPSPNNNRTQTLFGAEYSQTYQPYDNPQNLSIEYDFGINGSLRRKEADQNSEYYLFNAFNCMKAYSYNGERYGYYGYDASGERTYKYDIFSAGSWTNQTGGMDVSLQIDKMMLYPNGYLNMNQNGEYTKHYYADALRIASKIGSGFSQDLCYEANQIGNEVDPGYLDVRMNKQQDEMMEELTELINGNQITSINPIPYPEADLCNLSGSGIETALFFYHPDHLGSTGMVTDNSSNITQGFLYAPFGEIITEFNPSWESGRIPKYSFNAKELDEENGMYYYSARYYAPPTFISRDPMFEIRPWMSPYAYCANNPVITIDPTGETIWIIGENNETYEYKKGEEYKGESEFIKQTVDALNKGRSKSTTAERMLGELSGSEYDYNISKGDESNYRPKDQSTVINSNTDESFFPKGGGDIKWNPNGTEYFEQSPEGGPSVLVNRPEMGLFHELGHGWDNMAGVLASKDMTYKGLEVQEWTATRTENMIRKEMGLPLRTSYGINVWEGKKSVSFPLLLNSKGNHKYTKYQH